MAVSARPVTPPAEIIAAPATTDAQARLRELLVPFGIALLAASYVVLRGTTDREVSDFDQLWYGARAVFSGEDPYAHIGPFAKFEWSYLYYPMPALLLVSPLALLPLLAARACFAAISAGLLSAALLRERPARLLMFLSAPMLIAIGRGQLTPVLVAAAYFPSLAWVGVAKPNIALAILFGCEQPRTALKAAAVGGAVLIGASFIVDPSWISAWLGAVSHKTDGMSIVLRGGAGLILLAALLRWRRREARLLVAIGSVPQTPSFYDAIPLFMVPRGFREMALLVIGGNLALLLLVIAPGLRAEQIGPMYADRVMLWLLVCLYVPATLMVQRRPNDANPVPEHEFNGGRVDVALSVVLVVSTFFAGWAILSRFL
jgi:hypothetical protein